MATMLVMWGVLALTLVLAAAIAAAVAGARVERATADLHDMMSDMEAQDAADREDWRRAFDRWNQADLDEADEMAVEARRRLGLLDDERPNPPYAQHQSPEAETTTRAAWSRLGDDEGD